MADAISNAVKDIMYGIPRAILDKGLLRNNALWADLAGASVEYQIEQKVIRDRVLKDCNLVGGTQESIPLNGLSIQRYDDFTGVIRIPKDRTQGRSITSVLSIGYGMVNNPGGINTYAGGMGASYGGTVNQNIGTLAAATAVFNSNSVPPITNSTLVELIAENTIAIREPSLMRTDCYLRCILENQDNLGNLSPQSFPRFSTLCLLAAKAHLYNTLIVEVDSAELRGGFQLGVFKSILESYSDANQNYLDYLDGTWKRVAYMNDKVSRERLLRAAAGRGR